MGESWDYKKAGLDLGKYEETLAGIQPLLLRTHARGRVIPPPFPPRRGGKGVGGFAGLFDLDPDGRYRQPVLVTCTDGVGSKLQVAVRAGRFDTVGIDLVAMCVNDLICSGGEPLVFLDYLALSRDDPELTRALLTGVSDGCVEAGCSLVGGETAVLPDLYRPGDFDLAGFAAGLVERDRLIDGRAIRTGDVIIGVASSGLHANGFTLVRKVVFDVAGLAITDPVPELGKTVGEELLTPTRIYVRPVRDLLAATAPTAIHGLAHVTGGGLADNLGRILPPDKRAVVRRGSWPVPPVFPWVQKLGSVPDEEMARVFNLGVGFVVVCDPAAARGLVAHFERQELPAWVIGEIRDGPAGVEWVAA